MRESGAGAMLTRHSAERHTEPLEEPFATQSHTQHLF